MEMKEEIITDDPSIFSDFYIPPDVMENISNIIYENEDTMHLADISSTNMKYPVIQSLPPGPPERTNFHGVYNFTLSVPKNKSVEKAKKAFLYHESCNRIFVKYKSSFALEFKWAFEQAAIDLPYSNMYIRATLLYSDEQNWQKRVNRCIQHQHPDDPPIKYHILRSELNSDVVYYTGNDKQSDSWFSVVVEFSHPSLNAPLPASRSHSYNMACKNSCSSGINRRSTEIFFTLENAEGHVYGRQSVGIRSCACPKRDMNKEDDLQEIPKTKRPIKPSQSPPPTKRIMKTNPHNPNNDKVISIPSELEVIGADVLTTGFGVMINMMRLKAEKADEATKEKCAKSISKISAFLEPYEKE